MLLPSTRLVLFPGLGGDERYYLMQQSLPVRLETPSWIEPESDRETLPHYAERMAARIEPGGELYIGGVSLGAVVALEAARHLDVAGVIMISGCRSHRDLSLLFRFICSAASALPRQWVHSFIAALGPPGFALLERMTLAQTALMLEMMLSHSPRQLRWSARALMEWEFSCPLPAPVHSIHGEWDEVIPPRNVNADQVVAGGHHLINLTHPGEVNTFIARCIRKIPGSNQTLWVRQPGSVSCVERSEDSSANFPIANSPTVRHNFSDESHTERIYESS